jgi:hypothetical protein
VAWICISCNATRKGKLLRRRINGFGLNFEEKQYEYLSTAGIVLAKHLTIAPRSADVRVFARDTSSEALGSVTIPVQALFEGPQTASSLPAKSESRQ